MRTSLLSRIGKIGKAEILEIFAASNAVLQEVFTLMRLSKDMDYGCNPRRIHRQENPHFLINRVTGLSG